MAPNSPARPESSFLVSVGIVTLAAGLSLSVPEASAEPVPAARYSLPFQLRPAGVANVVRLDTAFASFEDAMGSGTTAATMVLGSYKVTPAIAAFGRIGIVNHAPADTATTSSFVNPALGAVYARQLAHGFRYAALLGVALPVGMGGGNDGNAARAAAARAGILARSALDNAMFALNDLVVFPGIDVAYVRGDLTLQAEATVLQLMRARGDAVQPDALKTNLTTGAYAGYFVSSWLSLGAELRYQRWLTTPVFVEQDPTRASRDSVTVAIGPRFHVELAPGIHVRPAIAYARAFDAPMADRSYHIVHIDVPASF